MFDNVVVGVDDYEAGRDALELAKQLVSPDGRHAAGLRRGGHARYPARTPTPSGSSTTAGARWSGSPRCETMRTPTRSC